MKYGSFEAFELEPYGARKSFYGKAKVIVRGNTKYLLSYETIVCSIDRDGKVHRHWDEWSATTGTHIKSFLFHYGLAKDYYSYNAKWWRKHKFEPLEADEVFYVKMTPLVIEASIELKKSMAENFAA